MDAAAKIGRNPVSKHQIQPEYGGRAGWRWTGRPNPSRDTKSSGANGDREIFIFPVQLTTSRIGSLTRLIHCLLYVITIWENARVHNIQHPPETFLYAFCVHLRSRRSRSDTSWYLAILRHLCFPSQVIIDEMILRGICSAHRATSPTKITPPTESIGVGAHGAAGGDTSRAAVRGLPVRARSGGRALGTRALEQAWWAALGHVLPRKVCITYMCVSDLFWTPRLWTYQPGSHRRNITQDFSTFILRCLPYFFSREGFSRSFPSSTMKSNFSTCWACFFVFVFVFFVRKNSSSCDDTEIQTHVRTSEGFEVTNGTIGATGRCRVFHNILKQNHLIETEVKSNSKYLIETKVKWRQVKVTSAVIRGMHVCVDSI